MNNQYLAELEAKRASFKTKLILGIVFTSIGGFLGLFLPIVAAMVGGAVLVAFVFMLSIPFLGVGIPFLASGASNCSRLNKEIAIARMNAAGYGAQQYSNAGAAYTAPEWNTAYSAQEPAPEASFGYTGENAGAEYAGASSDADTGFVDIDWMKYAPLDAGISYNPAKNYKFHRAEGFVGSVPQAFANRTYPKCPICCSADPYWTIAQHNQMSWKGNLYLFKCSACQGKEFKMEQLQEMSFRM